VYPALLPLMRTPRLPVVDRTDAPADLTGLVRFAERRNLVSARVPSRFKRSLPNNKSMLRNIQEERRIQINMFRLVTIIICCITTLTNSKLPTFRDATITELFFRQ
jgi:hypothetical protein